jgi:hypothetical protein
MSEKSGEDHWMVLVMAHRSARVAQRDAQQGFRRSSPPRNGLILPGARPSGRIACPVVEPRSGAPT